MTTEVGSQQKMILSEMARYNRKGMIQPEIPVR